MAEIRGPRSGGVAVELKEPAAETLEVEVLLAEDLEAEGRDDQGVVREILVAVELKEPAAVEECSLAVEFLEETRQIETPLNRALITIILIN